MQPEVRHRERVEVAQGSYKWETRGIKEPELKYMLEACFPIVDCNEVFIVIIKTKPTKYTWCTEQIFLLFLKQLTTLKIIDNQEIKKQIGIGKCRF